MTGGRPVLARRWRGSCPDGGDGRGRAARTRRTPRMPVEPRSMLCATGRSSSNPRSRRRARREWFANPAGKPLTPRESAVTRRSAFMSEHAVGHGRWRCSTSVYMRKSTRLNLSYHVLPTPSDQRRVACQGETKRVAFRQMIECGSLVKPTHVTDTCTSGPSMYEVGTILV